MSGSHHTNMAGWAYDLAILFWRIVINLFFREIRPRGAFNIPKVGDGPVMFVVGPHHNQFADPLLLASEVRKESGRRVAFLTAAKSMKHPFIGRAAKLMMSIPVVRAADNARSGSGQIVLHDSDPLLVNGINTKFISEVKERSTLVLPKSAGYASAEVAEVVSDTELKLKREFAVPAKSGPSDVKASARVRSGGPDGLAYKVLPHIDQEETYGAVYQRLNEHGSIGIFPEGGSHDRPDLLPLKAGFSIMAMGAMNANPDLRVKIVPVGLSYFHPHKFRSRAVVEFGAPIEVPTELVELYKKGGSSKRDACGKLLEVVHDGLKAVTLRAPDFETLLVIQAGRRLYKTPGQHLTLGQVVELNKRFIEGYLHYQHEPRIIELRTKIIAYNRLLRDMGLADHQVERASNRSAKSGILLIYRTGLLLWWGTLALPGFLTHAPIFVAAKLISRKKQKEALAGSTVKIEGRDVIATWKIIVSVVCTPLLYLVYAFLITIIAYRLDFAPAWRHWTPVAVIFVLPWFAVSALKFGEAGMDVFKSLRPLFVSLVPGNQRELNKLRDMRESLSNELSEIIDEFGPQLYENFDRSRMLPSASVPQTGSRPTMFSRKSHTGDSVLSHPMLWLDERIFGWSRSAAVGAAAWDNAKYDRVRSEPSTAPASPAESDDEFEADIDYDDVLAVMDSGHATRSPRSKRRRATSRGGKSYHDLTALRSETEDGLRKRQTAEAEGDDE